MNEWKKQVVNVIGFGVAVGSVFLTLLFLTSIAVFGKLILVEPNTWLLYFEIGLWCYGLVYSAICVYQCNFPLGRKIGA